MPARAAIEAQPVQLKETIRRPKAETTVLKRRNGTDLVLGTFDVSSMQTGRARDIDFAVSVGSMCKKCDKHAKKTEPTGLAVADKGEYNVGVVLDILDKATLSSLATRSVKGRESMGTDTTNPCYCSGSYTNHANPSCCNGN